MDENLAKIRHERSVKDFPGLRLEGDEYVEFAFKRAKICLKMIFAGVMGGLVLVLLAFLVVLMSQSMIDEMGRNFLFILLAALLASAIVIGLVAITIYNGNKMFITNKRAIQMEMNSLVQKSVNVIDLVSVEDASFRQDSLLQ